MPDTETSVGSSGGTQQLQLTPGDPRVVYGEHVLFLPPQSLTLLQLLAEKPGRIVGRAILARILGRNGIPLSDASVTAQVHRLRAQLAPGGLTIRTVRSVGYVLEVRRRGIGHAIAILLRRSLVRSAHENRRAHEE